MPAYQKTNVCVRATNSSEVACAIAWLSRFGKKTTLIDLSAPDKKDIGVFHPRTISKAPSTYPTTEEPDLIVSALSNGRYSVSYRTNRVTPRALVANNIERRISSARN